MIINGKNVQGLFVYSSDSAQMEFTKGDLVVSGDSIYVCDSETPISGIDPASDTSYEYYYPYPGPMIKSASEYFQSIKNEEGPDKYVSEKAIMGILQGYQFGLDMEGVITDWIDENGDSSLDLSQVSDRPIDNLMLTETLNRGMVKISPFLNQLVSGKLGGKDFSTIFGTLEKSYMSVITEHEEKVKYELILSQYTYKSSDTTFTRVQELMSPLTGISVYRYMYWKAGEFPIDGSVISEWRDIYTYSSSIKNRLSALQNYYDDINNQYRARINALENSFRFKEVYANGSSTTSNTVSGLSEGVYTVCVTGRSADSSVNKFYSESVVVNLKSGSTITINFNKLSGSVVVNGNAKTITVNGGNSIVSIYGREYIVT